jgi:hypothetical protein
MNLDQYLVSVKAKLNGSAIITSIALADKRANFPHHVHIGSESNVASGQSRHIIEFISFTKSELG